MMIRTALFILLASPVLVAQAETPAPVVPAEVRDASTRVREWLNTLRGKSEAQIADLVGKDYEKSTWEVLGKKELKIRYRFAKESTLMLLFKGDKVVKAEIYVMSEDEN